MLAYKKGKYYTSYDKKALLIDINNRAFKYASGIRMLKSWTTKDFIRINEACNKNKYAAEFNMDKGVIFLW